MDIVYRGEKVTARHIHSSMQDAPSYTSVRSHLRAMVDKGYLKTSQDGIRYVYSPVVPRKEAKDKALKNLLKNFFGGSKEDLIAALIDSESADLTNEQLEQIGKLIDEAKSRGN